MFFCITTMNKNMPNLTYHNYYSLQAVVLKCYFIE